MAQSSLQGSPEEQRGPGRLDMSPEENTRAGCPHVHKDQLTGKKTNLPEQRVLTGTQEERESVSPLEEGAESSGGLQRCCEFVQGENWKGQSLTRTQSGYCYKRK